MSEDTIARYLNAISRIEPRLRSLGFQRLSCKRKGPLCITKFIKRTTLVEFLFGPPEWHAEMFVRTTKGRFALKDLLDIPLVADWSNANGDDEVGVEAEVSWYASLLELSLPSIE